MKIINWVKSFILKNKKCTYKDLAFGVNPEDTRKLIELTKYKKTQKLFECLFCKEKDILKLNELILMSMVNPILGSEFYIHFNYHMKEI